MATKKVFLEDHDEKKDSDDKCPYAEAGKTILGDTSFHGLQGGSKFQKFGKPKKYPLDVVSIVPLSGKT